MLKKELGNIRCHWIFKMLLNMKLMQTKNHANKKFGVTGKYIKFYWIIHQPPPILEIWQWKMYYVVAKNRFHKVPETVTNFI